jgi:hypothetical protein
LTDRIDPHQYPISSQELLAYLAGELLVVDGRLGMDPDNSKLLEDAVEPWARAEKPMTTHTYSSYLEIDKLLSAQRSMTDSDDELLFIVIHQAHELWFKLAIHELSCAIEALHRDRPSNGDCIIAFKRLSRVSEIQPKGRRDRAVFSPDPRLCTAPRWPRTAAELAVV